MQNKQLLNHSTSLASDNFQIHICTVRTHWVYVYWTCAQKEERQATAIRHDVGSGLKTRW